MSARKVEPDIAVRHPRETSALFGHREAEAALPPLPNTNTVRSSSKLRSSMAMMSSISA